MYWFVRDCFARQITVCFAGCRELDNMNAFLAMSRHSELRRIVDDLADYQSGRYFACPGEYLELSVEDGVVTAQICLCDAIPCRMGVSFFCRLVTDYLAEWETMLRELHEQ